MRLAFAAALVLAAGLPAQASTLPPLHTAPQHVTVSIGVFDANVDVGLSDHWSVGVTSLSTPTLTGGPETSPLLGFMVLGLRSTYRIAGAPDTLSYGVTFSGGIFGPQYMGWLQPAFNAALPLGDVVTLRGTVGPIIQVPLGANTSPVAPLYVQNNNWFWPNLELGIRLQPQHELTLGGNSLVGWRGYF